MRGYSNWNYEPYIPINKYEDEKDRPYICRIAPRENSIEIECKSISDDVLLYYSERSKNEWQKLDTFIKKAENTYQFLIENLNKNTDYMFYVQTPEAKGIIRLARTGYVPGIVINYLHPEDKAYSFSGKYLCSPSIVKLPNGKLITSMDVHSGASPQNLTILCYSNDDGETWSYLCELFPCFWGKLFWHNNALYMLSTSTEYGDLLIGKSDDEGRTWSVPSVIMRGAASFIEAGFHKAPVVVIKEDERIWTAVEYGSWQKGFHCGLLSIDKNADPLKPENWQITNMLKHNPNWPDAVIHRAGGLEGNAVLTPEGKLVNILRYDEQKAMLLLADKTQPEKQLEFDSFFDFPIANHKFEILKCADVYIAIGNRPPKRNILSIYASYDLKDWVFIEDIINFEDMDINEVGFQYPAFEFDGGKLYVLSRTAFNNAANFHDSNYQTLHKLDYHLLIKKFKDKIQA